jgi:hypothetical protein
VGKSDGGNTPAVAAPDMDLVDLTGVIVLHVENGALAAFAQQGTGRWIDRSAHPAAPVTLKQGDFVTAGPDKPLKLQGRPSEEFVAALPRPYRDTLPFRYAMFKSRTVVPKNQAAFSYEEVLPWLTAETSVRRQFVVAWRRKADNAAFRAGLDRDLAKHPEWDPILHPERYETDSPQSGSASANTPSTTPRTSASADTPVPANR